MRNTFIKTLAELAATDKRIVLLTGDLGYMAIEPFADNFPDRFINVGVAEQNMVGLATGLAEAGMIPFVYSITPFATLRPYEFIRNGPVLHSLPVRIVGVGGGFEYGQNGPSHHGIEDVGVMRLHPGLGVVAPADFRQAATALRATWDMPGPVYYRLGKDDKTEVPGLDGRFDFEQVQMVHPGADALLLAMGSVAGQAVAAAQTLRQTDDIGCAVGVVAGINPPPAMALATLLARYTTVCTAEAHYVCGGLGSLVAEVIAGQGIPCRLVRCGVRTAPDGLSGSQQYLHNLHGISANALAQAVRDIIRKVT